MNGTTPTRNFSGALAFDRGWNLPLDKRTVMEENLTARTIRPLIPAALIVLVSVMISVFSISAQTTNLLNLCTEGALQAAVGIGGIYQFGNCGSNTLPTINLTEPLVVTRDLSLIATQEVLLDGQDLTRIMVVKPGVHLTLRNISFFSGRHTSTNFNDGGIPDTAGAGLYNDGGIVTIFDGHFQQNSVVGVSGLAGSGNGGDGESGGDAAGGAIYNNGGQVTLSNVVFIGNSVQAGAGGAGNGNGNLNGNGGNGGNGGAGGGAAIYSRAGTLTVFASTFTTNITTGAAAGAGGAASGFLAIPGVPGAAGDGAGGAISGDGGEITIYGCTFSGNSAVGAAGLAANAGLFNQAGGKGRNGGNASGGAVFSAGRLWITNATFFANTVTSGNGGAGGSGGTGVFGSAGGDGGDGGNATGAGVETVDGQTMVVNCTFSDNLATGGTGAAGGQKTGIGNSGRSGNTGFTSGSAVYGRSGQTVLANNILANSTTTVGGSVTDSGGNLSTEVNPLLNNNTSLRLRNPVLSALTDNGGPTQTMAIATNSPAMNAGITDFCPQFDQRWSNRVDRCDIGAFEVLSVGTSQPLPVIPADALNGLSLSSSSNLVTLTWPSGYTNLFLQFATNLMSSNTAWSVASITATTNSGSNVVTVNTTNKARPMAYFRLFGLTNLSLTNSISTSGGPPAPF